MEERKPERDRDRRTSGNGETCTTEQWCGEQQGPESQDSLGPSAPRTRRACAHSHHCRMSPPLFISVWCLEQAQLVHQDSNTSRTAPPQGGTAPLSPLPVPERRSLSGMTVYPSLPSRTTRGCQGLAVSVVTMLCRTALCRNTAATSHMQLFPSYIVRIKMISQSRKPHFKRCTATRTSGYHIG